MQMDLLCDSPMPTTHTDNASETHGRVDVVAALRSTEVVEGKERKRHGKFGGKRSSDTTSNSSSASSPSHRHSLFQKRSGSDVGSNSSGPRSRGGSRVSAKHSPPRRHSRQVSPSPEEQHDARDNNSREKEEEDREERAAGDATSEPRSSRRGSNSAPRDANGQRLCTHQRMNLLSDAAPRDLLPPQQQQQQHQQRRSREDDRSGAVKGQGSNEDVEEAGGPSSSDNFTRVTAAESANSQTSLGHNTYKFFFPSFMNGGKQVNGIVQPARVPPLQLQFQQEQHQEQQLQLSASHANGQARGEESPKKLAASMPVEPNVRSSGANTAKQEEPRTQSATQRRRTTVDAPPFTTSSQPVSQVRSSKQQPQQTPQPQPEMLMPSPRKVWPSVADWNLMMGQARNDAPDVDVPLMEEKVHRGRRNRNRNKILIQKEGNEQPEEYEVQALPSGQSPRRASRNANPTNRNTTANASAFNNIHDYRFPSVFEMPHRTNSPMQSFAMNGEPRQQRQEPAMGYGGASAVWRSAFGTFTVPDSEAQAGNPSVEYGGDLILPGQSVFGPFTADTNGNGMYSFFVPSNSPTSAYPMGTTSGGPMMPTQQQLQQEVKAGVDAEIKRPPMRGGVKVMSLNITAPMSDDDDDDEEKGRVDFDPTTAAAGNPAVAVAQSTMFGAQPAPPSAMFSADGQQQSDFTRMAPANMHQHDPPQQQQQRTLNYTRPSAFEPNTISKHSSLFATSVASFGHWPVTTAAGDPQGDQLNVVGQGEGEEEDDVVRPEDDNGDGAGDRRMNRKNSAQNSETRSVVGLDRKDTMSALNWLAETGRGKLTQDEPRMEPMRKVEALSSLYTTSHRHHTTRGRRRHPNQRHRRRSDDVSSESESDSTDSSDEDDDDESRSSSESESDEGEEDVDVDGEWEDHHPPQMQGHHAKHANTTNIALNSLQQQQQHHIATAAAISAVDEEEEEQMVDGAVLRRIMSESENFVDRTEEDEYERAYPTAPPTQASYPHPHQHRPQQFQQQAADRSLNAPPASPYFRAPYAGYAANGYLFLPPAAQQQQQQQPRGQRHRHSYASAGRMANGNSGFLPPHGWPDGSPTGVRAVAYLQTFGPTQGRKISPTDYNNMVVPDYRGSAGGGDVPFRQTMVSLPVHVLLGFDPETEIRRVNSPVWSRLPDA